MLIRRRHGEQGFSGQINRKKLGTVTPRPNRIKILAAVAVICRAVRFDPQ